MAAGEREIGNGDLVFRTAPDRGFTRTKLEERAPGRAVDGDQPGRAYQFGAVAGRCGDRIQALLLVGGHAVSTLIQTFIGSPLGMPMPCMSAFSGGIGSFCRFSP